MKMFAVLCDVRSYRTVHRSLVSFAAAACIGICGRMKEHPARTNQEGKAVRSSIWMNLLCNAVRSTLLGRGVHLNLFRSWFYLPSFLYPHMRIVLLVCLPHQILPLLNLTCFCGQNPNRDHHRRYAHLSHKILFVFYFFRFRLYTTTKTIRQHNDEQHHGPPVEVEEEDVHRVPVTTFCNFTRMTLPVFRSVQQQSSLHPWVLLVPSSCYTSLESSHVKLKRREDETKTSFVFVEL